jgi:hypothetical protein
LAPKVLAFKDEYEARVKNRTSSDNLTFGTCKNANIEENNTLSERPRAACARRTSKDLSADHQAAE